MMAAPSRAGRREASRATAWFAASDAGVLAAALAAIALVVLAYVRWLHVTNATTVALSLLLIVLLVASTARFWVAAMTSAAAMLAVNFFFLPPVGTFTIADPHNWVALFTFLAVSLVASNLSAAARARAQEAIERRQELAHLFDLSRDVLLTTDSREAIPQLARHVARRFSLDHVSICLPDAGGWQMYGSGDVQLSLDREALQTALSEATQTLEFDARARTYSGHRMIQVDGVPVRLVPLRLGARPIGLLAVAGSALEPGTLDALAGLAAIAIERAHLLDERKQAELARQSSELKSALLASVGHDLRTPLTAIRVAAANLQGALPDDQRREQSEIVLLEVERLSRLFDNILEMTRIDAGAVATERRWVFPSEILEAARQQVEHTLRQHSILVDDQSGTLVRVDPRLTASALAHVLENAAQYSPAGTEIRVGCRVGSDGLLVTVTDQGPGIAPADLPHLFDRFYRGVGASRRRTGTGMGLAIARGLLAAEGGRIWAENSPDGGARFSIVVSAEARPDASSEEQVP
jgi:two-component system, OmpR family, sensor histidine kinase KdpD